MTIRTLFSELKKNMFGCRHKSYEIDEVTLIHIKVYGHRWPRPRYVVVAKCNKCGYDCSHNVNALHGDDPRVVKASKWLCSHGLVYYD